MPAVTPPAAPKKSGPREKPLSDFGLESLIYSPENAGHHLDGPPVAGSPVGALREVLCPTSARIGVFSSEAFVSRPEGGP